MTTNSQDFLVPARRYRVVGSRGRDTAKSSRNVLVLEDKGPTLLHADEFTNLHLHHFDAEKGEAFWCRTANESAVASDPFYYQGIRKNAQEGFSVKFDDLTFWQRPMAARPIFIFSIGRCGSTLFSKVCEAAGLMTWSEPDSFTNLAISPKLQASPRRFRSLTRAALVDLADKTRVAGASEFGVKFRSEVNPICEDISSHHRDSVSFFLVRDPIEWAISRRRHWSIGPVRLAKLLIEHVENMRLAKSRGLAAHVLDYRSLVERPHEQVERLRNAIGLPQLETSALEAIMCTDSQKGSSIARGTGIVAPEDYIKKFKHAVYRRAPWILETDPQQWLE